MPEVGNGHLATVVGSDSLFMNGLYNGANLSSHRARIPSPSGYSIQSDSVRPSGLARTYSLDVGRGIFTETYQGGGVKVTLRTYAHSTLSNLLVSELALSRDDVNKEVKVNVKVNPGSPSEDVDFQKTTLGMLRGLTREAEYPELAPRTEFFLLTAGYLQGNITMSPNSRGETYLALAVLGHDKDIVLAEYALAMQAWESGQLLPLHTEGWTKFWNRGRIDIGGNIDMARLTYASLYYILSSLPLANDSGPSWPFFGVSPGGLAHGSRGKDYLGHIFWDQDTWIYPGVALLHPDLGRRVVETRTRTLDAARLLAKRTGYKGARFPWESAFTGLETCPADPYGEREIHINGDISFMFRQYWQLTHDMSLMRDGKGAELVWGVADFWASRVTQDRQTGAYRILGVMPPDEWHPLVNDSAYTNNIAIISLEFANQMKRIMGQPENPQWSEISARMVRPYDAVKDFHPEFDGFDPRGRTKQADVVLLSFPLMVDMKPSTRQNDLTIYDLTTPQGPAPAMTWGMFLVGWLELGDETKAETLLKRSIKNAQEPFQVWTENADGEGAVNFLTGMGGYLQSVLFGYGGCRIHDDLITFEPRLMPNVTRMRFVGLSYRGCSIDIEYDAEKLSLTMTSIDKGHGGLRVRFQEVGQWKDLVVGQRVDKKKQGFDLQSK
ncbi:acid trehalase-like protein 1 [Plakobranchus ocellatus]|uniref:Protein-glucosylgalactosylhydroxylysine glucosidase n=1 Tax=Plakobranchus ocellatus TaxID=259542 RepID=A0AAV4AUA9_9GAST|nr:acid trehalase-like protein 1 [Plakobranchus ocellatus]